MCKCNTRYPILLVHGTGFRDYKHVCYWGRIPKALENEGAVVCYGNQDSWGTIERNAEVLNRRLSDYIRATGCGKVNLIAHSKGGLEARYLASTLHGGPMIASITTISTPHHGSRLMDLILRLFARPLKAVSGVVNLWFRLLGDQTPDFFRVCQQFSSAYMREFNTLNPDVDGIYYQSFATVMKAPFSDCVMLLPNLLVSLTDGRNDGLVAVSSAMWTNFRGVWESATLRGISHADAVDLRRRRFSKDAGRRGVTDICDCYIELVERLRSDGF